jgi:hypothetical protein
MKTFKDLEFKKHLAFKGGVHALIFFPNGYGASVVNGDGSYTSNNTQYELAVLKGNKDDWGLNYDTHITDDVLGYLSSEDVTEIMKKIQSL